MASTSALCSSIQKNFRYDVFLSFRGEDTRKNFVDHLYHALEQKSICTYKDDEKIKKGKRISDELIRSIEDSKFYIIVFSKNYASSSWCLDELLKIMECQKMTEHTAYPIYYDVEPSDVRKQSGAVGEAISKHKEEEAIEKWREALTEASNLAGWELKNTLDGHEAKFIQKIVEEISLELRFINSSVDGKLIGMETRVKDVVSSLETGINVDDVRIIGIKGMGGAGKTTLARAIFDQISIQFKGSSFVENVREYSTRSLFGLKLLQKQILSDVRHEPDITINGVHEGKKMMKTMMLGIKVLVVLDDVDHIEQLEALAGEPSWFKQGSRVIVTTREEQVLVAHGVPKHLILDVNLLSHEEAICLFSRYAFGKDIPIQGYEQLSKQVVCYAAGLPLTIRVLGSFLCGKDELEWTDALERLETIPLKETLDVLELSYTRLEEDYKEIFLDVACILKGWEKDKAIRALESCGFHARNGLKVLEQKSLIAVSNTGHLSMHDHIEEMGKNIVRRMHPNEPYKHSRLWIHEEIRYIMVEDKGTNATRCVKLCMHNPVIVMKGLRNMKELRFLDVRFGETNDDDSHVECDDVDEHSQYLPNGLRYLCLNGYHFRCLPKSFQASNLVGLEMLFTDIDQLWEGGERKVLKKLRFIDLHYCKLRTLDVGLILNLERLSLVMCENLVQLHMPVEKFKLKYLELIHCKLMTLNLAHAQNLDTLKVKQCEDLVELHMPIESLKLKHLILQWSKLKTLNLTRYQNLETLDIECNNLEELHMPIESLKLKYLSLRWSKLKTLNLMRSKNLETLDLVCNDLVELNMPVENFQLKSLNLCGSKLRTLDIGYTQYLEKLSIYDNDNLVELHLPVKKLKHLSLRFSKMRTLNLTHTLNLETLDLVCEDLVEIHMPTETFKLKSINLCHSKLTNLDLEQAQYLERLNIQNNDHLLELHMPIESPNLKIINISCSELRTLYLGLSPCIECLDLHDCFNLVEIRAPVGCRNGYVKFKPILVNKGLPVGSLAELHLTARSLGICPLHPDYNGPKFHFECIYMDFLPSSTGNLKKLISFSPCACINLASLSGIIYHLQLRKLTLEGNIPEVPKDFDQLECLEELTLLSTKIEHLPDTICMLKHLKFLQLKFCLFLKHLPEDLGRLECLEELRITDCTSLRDIPNSICKMKHLKCFHLTNCILVDKLPKEIGRLKCLKELNVEGTGIRDFPPSIFQLEDLLFLL